MCRASGQDSMRDLLPVFSDNESSAGDCGNGLLESDACGIVSDGCSSEPVSVDSLYGQLVLRGGTSEYPESTGLVYDDHLDLGCGNLCIHVIYKTALAELSYICVIRWKKTARFRLWMEKKRI